MIEPQRKKYLLVGLLVLQAVCVISIMGEAVADLVTGTATAGDDDRFEYAIVLALVLSLVFTAIEIKKLLARNTRIEHQLKAASGDFHELLELSFDKWVLSASERDVALLAIKGLSIAEIAGLRNTKEGTIKAQLNAIYRKADVSGRPQLISSFIEELMGDALTARS